MTNPRHKLTVLCPIKGSELGTAQEAAQCQALTSLFWAAAIVLKVVYLGRTNKRYGWTWAYSEWKDDISLDECSIPPDTVSPLRCGHSTGGFHKTGETLSHIVSWKEHSHCFTAITAHNICQITPRLVRLTIDLPDIPQTCPVRHVLRASAKEGG